MIRQLIIVIFFIFNMQNILAQTVLSGRVSAKDTGQPLQSANIEILNSKRGTTTNAQGIYQLQLDKGSYKLRFSMMGYTTVVEQLDVGDSPQILDIILIPTVYFLQGVTVIQPTVKDEEAAVSNNTIQSENVRRMPGSLTDIYRSVKTLPGVASNNGMSSEFNVRGGTFDENLVLVNGAQVYRPFHIKEAPNGSVAIFNMDLLKQVDLITGGFTARYGDKMSSVMNVQYREGNKDRFQLRATGSMMHAGLVAEGPSYKGSWIVGIRQSYLQYILTLLGEDDAVNVDFYDIQGQISSEIVPGKKLEFQFIHSGDNFEYGPKRTRTQTSEEYQWHTSDINSEYLDHEKANYYNNLFALSFDNVVNPNLYFKTILSHYAEYEDENGDYTDDWSQYVWDKYRNRPYNWYSNGQETRRNDLKIFTSEAKQEVTWKANAYHEFLTGITYQHLKYDYTRKVDEAYYWGNSYDAYPDTLNYTYENQEYEDIHPSTYKIAGYLEDNYQVSSRIHANIGLRIDYFEFNREMNLSPRINLSYLTGFGPIIRAAWGHYYQSPSYRELKYQYATENNTKAQRSIHHILGIEYPVSDHWKLKLEGYYKKMDNLITFENRNGNFTYSQSNDSKGYTTGLDLFINYTYQKLSGWLSYGYLIAKEDSIGDNKGYIPRLTDQRHTLALVSDFDLGKSWELRFKVMYGSGFPYTPSDFLLVDEERNIWEEVTGERNSARLPSYQRFDVRVGKHFRWGRAHIQTYLEMINALNRDNVYAYDWDWNDGGWVKETITLMPLIPNFGFEIVF